MLATNSKLFIVAFIPRSGSNYLCDMMCRVGGLGAPLEYYYPYDFAERVAYWDSREDPFERIDKNLVKTQLQFFAEVVDREALDCTWDAHQVMLEEVGSAINLVDRKYIYLRRKDKLRQAISWHRALSSGKWTSLEKEQQPPTYDYEKIKECLGWIEEHEIWWGDYLKDYEHLDLFYEDLNYGILKVVEEFMGRNRNRNRTIDSDHKKLRDELTEQWVERFRSEFQSYEGRTLPE